MKRAVPNVLIIAFTISVSQAPFCQRF